MSPADTANKDRGATAILIAMSMLLLIGFVAVAIDLGLGFNERRQDQTSADIGVMAGAVNYIDPSSSPTNENIVTDVLDYTRDNLDSTYTDPEWQALWQPPNCTDPERINFDVGGQTVTFLPMDQPSSWSGGTGELDCISRSSSYLRVRLPDQLVDTSFAQVLGFDNVTTHAAAVARIEPGEDFGGLVPFGIPGGTGAGEICVKSSGSGTSEPPCQGGSAGAFGEINSEFFGDYFGSPSCANPGDTELAQNVAIGLDHFVALWPSSSAAAEGVTVGSTHPGDGAVGSYQEIGFDQCSLSGGSVVPQNAGHIFPPNTVRVATGFSPAPIEEGLMSNQTFLGENSRLQQGSNPTRPVVKRRQGSLETIYDLDNVGLWDYLIDAPGSNPSNECDRSNYAALTLDEKVALIHDCLRNYSNGDGVIFQSGIADSPRFAWAPEYWHANSTTGLSFQPVMGYRMIFLGGLYFNCNASVCVIFYPDSTDNSEVCDSGAGSNCQVLSISQLSAWLIPNQAVPQDVLESFPGAESPFITTLFK